MQEESPVQTPPAVQESQNGSADVPVEDRNTDTAGWDDDGDGEISDEEYLAHADISETMSVNNNGIPNDHKVKFDNADEAWAAGEQWIEDHWGHFNIEYGTENGKPVYWLLLTRAKR